MKPKTLLRIVIDIVMLLLMLVLMASSLTGDTVHEVLGVSFGGLFIAHNILNWRWYLGLFKGKYNAIRILHTAANLLLLVTMLALMVSAVLISQCVFVFLGLNGGLIWQKIHLCVAYWGFILMSVHLGMHWEMIMHSMRMITKTTTANYIRTCSLRILAALITTYGMYASFSRNVGSKLILQNTFDFWDYSKPAVFFFIDYLSIMGLYVCITYYVLKLIQNHKNSNLL